MSIAQLRGRVEALFEARQLERSEARPIVDELLAALESGEVRAAECVDERWVVHRWVKQGILLGFRIGANAPSSSPDTFFFRDRDTFPT